MANIRILLLWSSAVLLVYACGVAVGRAQLVAGPDLFSAPIDGSSRQTSRAALDLIPRVCGVGGTSATAPALLSSTSGILPAGMRSIEPVPGIIRNDGIDFFRLEVDANGPVSNIVWQLDPWTYYFVPEELGQTHFLHDDGLDGDRVAGDFIFTSERIRYNTNAPFPPNFAWDSNSPTGLACMQIGAELLFTEVDGTTNKMLISVPEAGVLDINVPLRKSVSVLSNLVLSPYLINVKTGGRWAQRALRGGGFSDTLTRPIYSVLPDAFDFLLFFSSDRVEVQPRTADANYWAGIHHTVAVKFKGTGQPLFTNSSSFGSAGRLLGLVTIDDFNRGLSSYFPTHELLHTWCAYLQSLGLSDGFHYPTAWDVGSLVGGVVLSLTNSTYKVNCDGFFRAPMLDKYMMGLVSGSQVPPVRQISDPVRCEALITNFSRSVTIAQIQTTYGVRTPGPATAQRDISMAFVVETFNRFLTPVELTFYDILAEHYTALVSADLPEPELVGGWAPMTRFFGEGTTWHSDVLSVISAKIGSVQKLNTGAQINATGYAGRTYSLQRSSNLANWTNVTSKIAATNGGLTFLDTNATRLSSQFYRVSLP